MLTEAAASKIYTSFRSDFSEEKGRMDQWLKTRVQNLYKANKCPNTKLLENQTFSSSIKVELSFFIFYFLFFVFCILRRYAGREHEFEEV